MFALLITAVVFSFVILEHSVLGLHTCLVPVLLSSPLLQLGLCNTSSCRTIPCLGLCTSIHSLCASRCNTCFDIARQTPCRHYLHVGHYGQPTVTYKEAWMGALESSKQLRLLHVSSGCRLTQTRSSFVKCCALS
jgi:hypothetical protein